MSKFNYQENDLPKVSCLTVTADRKNLMRRAVRCFKNQSYPNKELVVIDDGKQNLQEVLDSLPPNQFKYIKLPAQPENTLGELRNRSLKEATGDFIAQWDDDDWYHPDRLKIQAQMLLEGYDACCLSGTLIHLNEEPYKNHPYIGLLPEGIPGSIMHRPSEEIRYPHTRRAEDTAYLKKWMQKRYVQLPKEYSYLCIRCYHGSNTWGKNHFLRRIRNNPKDALLYMWHKLVKGNLFGHPKFQLSSSAEQTFQHYLRASKKLGLL